MKGLDTNVLVRYLLKDDLVQYEKAEKFIQEQCTLEHPCLISSVVLCELVWVLESVYKMEKPIVTKVLEQIIRTVEFELSVGDCVWSALFDFKNSNADFSDCLIGRTNHHRGCDQTVTFDQSASKLPNFSLL